MTWRLGLLLSLVGLWGCSRATDLAVLNTASVPIQVTIRLRPGAWSPSSTTYLNPPPAVLPITGLPSQPIWLPLAASGYSWDPDSSTVTVALPPGSALRFGRVLKRGASLGDSTMPDLSVISIRITLMNEYVSLTPTQAFPLFKRHSPNLYTLSLSDLPLELE